MCVGAFFNGVTGRSSGRGSLLGLPRPMGRSIVCRTCGEVTKRSYLGTKMFMNGLNLRITLRRFFVSPVLWSLGRRLFALRFDDFTDNVSLHQVASVGAVANVLESLRGILARLLQEHLLATWMLRTYRSINYLLVFQNRVRYSIYLKLYLYSES